MLLVNIYRNKKGQIYSYKAFGHCEFDKLGKDIVCASASTLLQVSILGINKYCRIKPVIVMSEGYLECTLPKLKSLRIMRDVQAILETMATGLKEIENFYPENIEIVELESK